MVFSADETTRRRRRHRVSPSATTTRPSGSRFTGTVAWVQLDIDGAAENLDHRISPEERLKIAMARQ